MKNFLSLLLLIILSFSTFSASAKKDSNFRLSSAETTPKVLRYIQEAYIDPSRLDLKELLKGSLDQLQKSAAEILITFESDDKLSITVDKAQKRFAYGNLKNLQNLYDILSEIYAFIEIHYHGSIEQQDLEYIILDGLLSKLDPHSNLLTPKVYEEFKVGTRGKFGGIGIVIGNKDGILTVISPIEDTPAWNAGIKAGDKIIQIADKSTVNMTLTEAVEILRGDVGTPVTVTVDRKGKVAPFNVTLKRAIIKIDSVQSKPLEVDGKTIGYIKLKNFQEDTSKEFSKQLAKLRAAPNFAGLILDLRNDPGGLLNQAVEVVDKFVSEGVIVSTIGAGNKFLEQEVANGIGTEPPYPLVILVNEGSASASEIVAGTLQSLGRAIVIGTKTFGKGSVQTIYDLKDGSALKLTIAEYLTAGKNAIQTIGVMPDIKLIEATPDKEKMNLIEDEVESENTLDKHLTRYLESTQKEPLYKINYYKQAEKDDDEATSKKEYSRKLDLSDDKSVQLASQILVNAPTDSYKDILKNLAPAVEKFQKGEDGQIATALNTMGIDWSSCTNKGKPTLQVSYSLLKNGVEVKEVNAGDKIELQLKAKNVGSGPFCRLVGISDSKEDYLKNIEFVFGKLPEQAEKTFKAPIKLPMTLPTEHLPIKVKFTEANANNPFEFNAIIPVKQLQQPRFAFQFKLGSPLGTKVESVGFPVGKTIPINLEVKNTGSGDAPNVFAAIKDIDVKGVFIETGRVKLGKIEAGKTKTATFKFKIEPSLSKSAFDMELTIADQDLYTAVTKKFEFNSGKGSSTPSAGRWYEAPLITLGNIGLPIVTTGVKYRLEGDITDDVEVKDYMIFNGDDKISYVSNPTPGKTFHFSSDLSLKDGNNLITVIARDNLDLVTRNTFVIEKK